MCSEEILERRKKIDLTCPVPCKAIQEKAFVPFGWFISVLSGIGLVGIIFATMLFDNQKEIKQTIGIINTTVAVTVHEVKEIKEGLKQVGRELRVHNGHSKKKQKSLYQDPTDE